MKNSTYIEKKWMHFKVSTLSASITALVIAGVPSASIASDIDIYQAGGTGKINIYFMLDRSLSMGDDNSYGGLLKDYIFTADSGRNMYQISTGRTYTSKTSGSGYTLTFEAYVGGDYKLKNGSTTQYEYVGPDNGTHMVKSVSSSTSAASTSNIRYDRSTSTNNSIVSNSTERIQFCNTAARTSQLSSALTTGLYNTPYTSTNEKVCLINVGLLDISRPKEKAYIDKIDSICELRSGYTTQYYCLTRLANLKKGLLNLIDDARITEDMNFVIGFYQGDSATSGKTHSNFIANSKTIFIPMDASGKTKFRSAVSSLTLSGSTPIAYGYRHAANSFNGDSMSGSTLSCTGNGIYFLTDGVPQNSSGSVISTSSSSAAFPPDTSVSNKSYFPAYFKNVAGYAEALKAGTYKIKTATIGFGGEYYLEDNNTVLDGNFECEKYSNANKRDQAALCYWGEKSADHGQGGFYNAQSADDLVNSIFQFVNDVSVPIEGSTMGSSTIPVDALNSTQLQPYSYFPMFKPLINSDDQLWAGNLKKFKVNTISGTVTDKNNYTVFDGDNIRDSLEDYWLETAGSSTNDTKMAWGGLLSKLKVHNKPSLTSTGTIQSFNRELYINQDGQLKKAAAVLDSAIQPENAQYLYGLLGYSKLSSADFDALLKKTNGTKLTYAEQLTYLKGKASSQDYQMGSVIHSTPIMLTQEGSFGYEGINYVSKGRKDYILAGTTQGLVQVVDAESGKEVFSFVPAEFLSGSTDQSKGFAESLAMNRRADTTKDQFFYGVDGPWVAYAEYKNTYSEDISSNSETEKMIATKQYVYGGLRMGGKSYYGLNLTKLGSTVASEKPKMLFHIDPANAPTTSPLSYMGQSWSKPTVTHIRWNGQKKLVMIVGGGYDPQYEDPAFVSSTTKPVKGNGIYIFDALNGDLLWWSSSNAPESAVTQATITDNRVTAPESNQISDMKHSIPSRIKAVDRDGDGVTDHLYVADLGGQLFRVDLNAKHKITSTASEKQPFVLNAFKLADMNDTNGKRRFYEPPTFTIHKDGGKRFAVLALSSGDRSNPLKTATNAPSDVVIAIEDHGVTQNPPVKPNITLSDLHNLSGAFSRLDTAKGWYYPTVISETRIKGDKSETVTLKLRGFEPGIALDNDLYFSLFNPDKSTADTANVTSCTGGITGESIAYKFCLPYGICSATVKGPLKVGSLGPGILGLTLGPGRSSETNRTLIFNKATSPVPPEYTVTDKLVPRRWYEYLPYKSGS